MSRQNICVSLDLQPNRDWLSQTGIAFSYTGLACGCPQFSTAPAGFNLPVNSTSLPTFPAVPAMLGADDGVVQLVVDGGTAYLKLRQIDGTMTGHQTPLSSIRQGLGQNEAQISTFNNWNIELVGRGKYPHSRQSGLPPGGIRYRSDQRPRPNSKDKGGTTVS